MNANELRKEIARLKRARTHETDSTISASHPLPHRGVGEGIGEVKTMNTNDLGTA